MLRHLGEVRRGRGDRERAPRDAGERQGATRDVVGDDGAAIGTTAFTDAIIANLGNSLAGVAGARVQADQDAATSRPTRSCVRPASAGVVGVDVFVESDLRPDQLGPGVERLIEASPLSLKMVTNRGTKVYPPTGTPTDCVDAYRAASCADRAGEVADAGSARRC